MIRFTFILSIALICMPLSAQQPSADAPVAAPTSKREALGYEIAKTTNNEALTRVQFDKMLKDTLPKQLAANPDFVELESVYPGFTNKFIEAMAPVVIEGIVPSLPRLWQRLGVLYSGHFTEAELQKLLTFYRSPVGTRLLDVMGRRSDFTKVLSETMKDPDGKITADDINSGQQIGIRAIATELTAAELDEIRRFEGSSVGPKLVAIAPQLQQITAEWGNEPTPELDAEMERVITAVLRPYLEARVAK